MSEQPALFIYPATHPMCSECDVYAAVVLAFFEHHEPGVPLCGMCSLASESDIIYLRCLSK